MTLAGQPKSATPQVFTVTQLNRLIKDRIETDNRLIQCHITGEISNFKHHSSGHMYLTLKDETSKIRAIMFAGRNRRLRFRPEDGMRVICIGNISVFDRDGQYQLYIDDMQPDGIGALYVQFEQMRERLQREGLFSQERKRPLPAYPMRIGVVTSPTGAVIRDIYTTVERRYPLAKIILAPALVQGPGAAQTLVDGMRLLWRLKEPVDVIIIGRGGGSLEELWPFNEEIVARAVVASPVPVVSAVGHETDVTICDFVADVRAATPTAAAEMVVPNRQDITLQLRQAMVRSYQAITGRIRVTRQTINNIAERPVLAHPRRVLQGHRQNVDYVERRVRDAMLRPIRLRTRTLSELEKRLGRIDFHRRVYNWQHQVSTQQDRILNVVRNRVQQGEAQLYRHIGMLEALNPLGVLRRGYSVVYDESETEILSSVAEMKPGTTIRVQVADGTVTAEVKGDKENGRTEQIRLDI